jgi:hypothetical protein
MNPEAIGYVTQVHCQQCSQAFPVFTFSADTDMATDGWGALTRTDNKDIAIAWLKPRETDTALQERIGPPYRASRLSVITAAHGESGVPFQEFLKSYQPAVVGYSCIFCDGTAMPTGTETVREFESHNKIEVLSRST